jgi:hypothetical protein
VIVTSPFQKRSKEKPPSLKREVFSLGLPCMSEDGWGIDSRTWSHASARVVVERSNALYLSIVRKYAPEPIPTAETMRCYRRR